MPVFIFTNEELLLDALQLRALDLMAQHVNNMPRAMLASTHADMRISNNEPLTLGAAAMLTRACT